MKDNSFGPKINFLRILVLIISLKLMSGCSTTGVILKMNQEIKKQDFNFPTVLEIPSNEKDLTNDKIEKIILQISRLENDSEKNYLLRDLYLKGNDLKERDESPRAAFIYKILINFYPNSFEIHRDVIVSLIRATSFEEAERYLNLAIDKKFKEKTSFMLILAGLYSATGRESESQKIYENVLTLDNGNEEACIFLAKNYNSSGKLKKSISTLKGCAKANKENPIFYYYLGKIYLINQDQKNADIYFNKSLKINSNYYQAALGRGLIKEENKDFKNAAKIYQDYLELDGSNLVILNRLVQVLFVLEDFDRIIPYLEELITLESDNINLKVKLGILYTEKKNFRKAINIFQEILKIAPNSDKVLYYLGALFQQLEEYDSAISYYLQIPKQSDLFFDSSLQVSKLLRALVAMNKTTDPFQTIQAIIVKIDDDKSPQSQKLRDDLFFTEAYFYGHQKKYQKSVETIKKIKELDLNQKYYLANIFDKMKKYQEAIELMLGVLKDNPNNAHALNFAGYLILENELDFPKAYSLIKKAIEIEPNDAYIRDSLGWYFFKIGDFEKALVELKKAWNKEKSDIVITKHLAIVYQKLNNDIEAQKYFAEALKNCTEEKQKKEIIDVMEKRILRRLPASLIGDSY